MYYLDVMKPVPAFGSFARDEARPDRDVDLLVEFEHPVGFILHSSDHRSSSKGCSAAR